MKRTKQGFTFIELIIVVIILGILGTIGFVSYTGYVGGTRDANRITQVKDIYKSLQLYSTNKYLPLPDDYVTVTASGATIGYQGYAGAGILQQIGYSNGGVDPKDNTYFTYYISKNKKDLQILTFLEETDNLETKVAFLPQTYAADLSIRNPKTVGTKLGVLIEDSTNIPIQDVSTIATAGSLDIVNTLGSYQAIFTDTESISGTGVVLSSLKSKFSCERLLQLGKSKGDGKYTIDPTGESPIEVLCDMKTDGGGWTRVLYFPTSSTPWNPYTTDETIENSTADAIFGMKINQFSTDTNGEDLEYMFKVDGVQKGHIYSDVNYQAWDDTMGTSTFDTVFSRRVVGDSESIECTSSGLRHANAAWNWSITNGSSAACDGYASGGGFLLVNTTRIDGLDTYSADTAWSYIEVWIR